MAAYFVDEEWTCPQSVQLEDGTWAHAPYMEWSPNEGIWKCFICNSNTGIRVTADHLVAARHDGRTKGPWNQLGHFTHGWTQQIVQIHTDFNYVIPPPQQQLALPARQPAPVPPGRQHPPAAPAGQPAPAAPAAPAGQPMGRGTDATHEAIEESNLLLQRIDERLQSVADRIAETNVLTTTANERLATSTELLTVANQLMERANDQLGVLIQAAPRGSPSQAVRATRGDLLAPYAQQHQ